VLETLKAEIKFAPALHFFYNSFIAALDGNRGCMNSSELIQACNQAKLHNITTEFNYTKAVSV